MGEVKIYGVNVTLPEGVEADLDKQCLVYKGVEIGVSISKHNTPMFNILNSTTHQLVEFEWLDQCRAYIDAHPDLHGQDRPI